MLTLPFTFFKKKESILETLNHLFKRNADWAQSVEQENPGFFAALSKQQSPLYLWIGCSDSRVPASQIVNLPPGELFVHRNIANLVIEDDLNCLSVIQYAVEVLKVKHIIICGHYGCGGIRAAMENQQLGLIDDWLKHIKTIESFDSDLFDELREMEQYDKLCELNVAEQIKNLSRTDAVKKAWESKQPLVIHGIIYDLKTGILKNLDHTVSSQQEVCHLPG